MFRFNHSKKSLVISLVLVAAILVGCAKAKAPSQSAGTGVVTETTMTDTVDSSGSISADQLATLNWNTSGTVSNVSVTTNQSVKNGDVLMALDSATAPANVIQAIVDLVSAQQALDNAKLSKTSIAQAEVTLAAAQSAYNSALGRYYTIGTPVGNQNTIEILKTQLLLAQKKVDDALTAYNKFAETPDGDTRKAQAIANLAQAKIDRDAAQASLNYYTNNPNTLDAATIKANMDLAKAQLDDAQRAYDNLKNGTNTDAITSAQAKVDAAQANVNSLKIIAPFDGDVVVVYSKPGDVVSQNTTAAIIVNRSKLYIDVSVDETSISNVKVGDTAQITFDAISGLTETGKVTLVNPIGVQSSGVVNYTVRIELDKTDPKILIGATANVTIQTGQPHSVLFVPVSAVQNDAQGEYVMRVTSSGGSERVPVVSGQITDNLVVVVGNLKAKDQVLLFTTTSTTNSSNGIGGGRGGGILVP